MRPEKQTMVDEIRQKLDGKVFVILADYNGLSVEKTAALRNRLRDADAEYAVIKNRLMNRLVGELNLEGLEAGLSGPTAIVTGSGDVVEAAKILKAFIKENAKPVIKLGAFSGAILTADDVEKLASMPPREELLAKAVGTIAAPLTHLVGVMNQKVCSLLYVLQAVKDKKEQA